MESLLAKLDEGRPGAAVPRGRVPVLLPVALDQTYDYLLPPDLAGLEVAPGMFVLVPFGPQTRIGIVWDGPVGDSGKPVADKKLKAITQPLDVPALPASAMRFAEWVARYTLSPLGMVVRMMMGSHAVFEPVRPRFGVRLAPDATAPPRLTPARRRALDVAADGLIRAKSALATEAACTSGVVDGLVTAGMLVEVAIPERRTPRPDPAHAHVEFGAHQTAAAQAMRTAVDNAAFSVTVLDGVTGSGKTEVYFEAVARTLETGRQALIMLPEIALTSQFMDRFARRCLVERRTGFDQPVGQAIAAESGQPHQFDVLRIVTMAQMADQPPERGGLDFRSRFIADFRHRRAPVQTIRMRS